MAFQACKDSHRLRIAAEQTIPHLYPSSTTFRNCSAVEMKRTDIDTEGLFLLPYDEVSSTTLVNTTSTPLIEKEIQQNGHSSAIEGQRFTAIDLKRTGNGEIPNGTISNKHKGRFRIVIGQFILLRPNENISRPGVAQLVELFENKQTKEPQMRVRWFYRAEDLSERPIDVIGEDEVFETQHFDTIKPESIAGRCVVSSYSEWLTTVLDVRLLSKHEENKKLAEKIRTRDLNQNGDDGNQIMTDLPNSTENDEYDSSAESDFGENYGSSAVRYYCRRFYDPTMNKFVRSSFEYEGADPTEEILAEREGQSRKRLVGLDDEFREEANDTNSSGAELEAIEYDEEQEKRKYSRKRPRSSTKQPRAAPRRRDKQNVANQFSLPGEIGVSGELPCRDEQKEHVRNFLVSAIQDSTGEGPGGSRCLYISGVPGTGKTATVREVLNGLVMERASGKIASFETVEINAMTLPDPNLVYSELYTVITGNRGVAPMHAAQLLEQRFATNAKKSEKKTTKQGRGGPSGREVGTCIILILDEMDVLLARKQKVLYDMLEWPTRKNARMAVIGIANTMDLPERMLPRLGSRLGVNRLSYPPYTSKQLEIILDMRLDQSEVKYSRAAIKLCAAKVGSISGDVRRALELCRRAREIMTTKLSEENNEQTITPSHINEAIQDVAGGSILVALTQLSLFERLVLVCALDLARTQGSFEMDSTCSIAAVAKRGLDMATRFSKWFQNVGKPTRFELEEACWRLAEQRIFLLERHCVHRFSRVIVNVSADDCSFALRECELSTKILGESN